MSNDGLFSAVALLGAIAAGPSNAGQRSDGKICTAQGGECRFNSRYYTPGMRDAKSWQPPCADHTCPERCPYLDERPRDMGSNDECHARAFGLIDALGEAQQARDTEARLFMAMLGIDIDAE